MSTNKTIAKNALFLYFRMFLTMGVGLYTSRLVLDALGVVDYGIYGLVGGIVSMFAFLNSAMASATQRYLSFDIGKKDWDRLQKTFNATLNIHILIAIVIFILAETIGLWFVNTQLEIPKERMYAANWVYQFSIFAFLLNVVQVPYNALLFAREHMSVYAYVSILETVLKLAIVLYLVQADSDKLILYSILTFGVAFVIRMTYQIYCRKRFPESKYKFYWNKAYYKELMSYSGWNYFSNIGNIARKHGGNILLNIFIGPVANAAYSIALMVQGIVWSFVSNFQMAVTPQITKNYAKEDKNRTMLLINKSAKYSFFALLMLLIPIIYNLEYILELWLKQVPKYSIGLINFALIYSLIQTISNPLISGIQSTGKIKSHQIVFGVLYFLNLPIVWLVLKYTKTPEYTFLVFCFIAIVALFIHLYYIKLLMNFNVKLFVYDVILRLLAISAILYGVYYLFTTKVQTAFDFLTFIKQSLILVSINVIIVLFLGFDKLERKFIINYLNIKLTKRKDI